MADSHVTPTDHQYWTPKTVDFSKDFTKQEAAYKIFAPADGVITQLEHHTQIFSENPANAPKIDDWRIIITHSCALYSIFIHIDKLDPEIQKQVGPPHGSESGTTSYPANIPVKEGQVIGRLALHSFDFSVHDNNVILKGLINPKRYEGEFWKIHTVDPFAYFKEPIRSQLLAKVVRNTEPMAGKIDYDIPGKLAGNWFRQGTSFERQHGGRFWDSELTMAYDHHDPKNVIISTGNFDGKAGQFAVLGNLPDPATVGVGTVTEYELVGYHYVTGAGTRWEGKSYAAGVKLEPESKVVGVALFELVSNDKVKVEFFPGQIASQISNFSPKAQIYER